MNSYAKSLRGQIFVIPADFVEPKVGGLRNGINVRGSERLVPKSSNN